MSIHPSIDWEQLARDVGALQNGNKEIGSTFLAQMALEQLIGEQEWQAAVDHYVNIQPGAELVRSVLWLVHPWAGMKRCDEIFRTSKDLDQRRTAIELLRVVADKRVLPWIQEYLDDSDAGIQQWAAGIVDQLLWSELIAPEDCSVLLSEMETHHNTAVQKTAEWIRSFLRDREDQINTNVETNGNTEK